MAIKSRLEDWTWDKILDWILNGLGWAVTILIWPIVRTASDRVVYITQGVAIVLCLIGLGLGTLFMYRKRWKHGGVTLLLGVLLVVSAFVAPNYRKPLGTPGELVGKPEPRSELPLEPTPESNPALRTVEPKAKVEPATSQTPPSQKAPPREYKQENKQSGGRNNVQQNNIYGNNSYTNQAPIPVLTIERQEPNCGADKCTVMVALRTDTTFQNTEIFISFDEPPEEIIGASFEGSEMPTMFLGSRCEGRRAIFAVGAPAWLASSTLKVRIASKRPIRALKAGLND